MTLGLVAALLAFAPSPAGGAARTHVVTEIRVLPGATARPTVTLPNGRPTPLAVRETLPDGAKIDVPLLVTVVIASTGAKSTTTLRPDTTFTLISTGAGEKSSVEHGSAVFSVVHGALDFFQVKYGTTFTASARGTVFSVDTAGKKVTFACERGTIDVAYAARLQIGAKQSAQSHPPSPAAGGGSAASVAAPPAVRKIDVIPAGSRSASFAVGPQQFVQRFGTVEAARAEYEAQLVRAKASGDRELIAAGYNNLGTVESAQGNYDRALADYEEAVRLDPGDAIAYYNRGNAYYRKGDYSRARSNYDEAIRRDPNFASAYTNRGAAIDETGDHDGALVDLDTALRLNPANAVAWYDRGNVHRSKHDYAHAIADYTEANRLDPSPETLYNRGLTLSDSGDEDRAIVDYTAAIGLRPNYAFAFNNRGVSYDEKGDHVRALADYRRAVELDPNDAIAHFNRGNRLRLEGGDTDGALADYNEAIRLSPRYAGAFTNRGLVFETKGDRVRAMADFEAALQIDPSFVPAKRGRARMLAAQADAEDDRGEYARAIADYEAALRDNPALSVAAVGLGADYFAAGERERAVTALTSAIAATPTEAYPYAMRGLANLYGGSLDIARADFDKATALDPSSAFAALLAEVAARRAHAPSRLADASKQFDMTVWPAPIVRLFLGQSTTAAMFAAAQDPDPAKQRDQVCNANFYAAEYVLLQGAKADAIPLYRLAARDCPTNIGRGTARAALRAMGAQP